MKYVRSLAVRVAILITLAAAPGLAETSITSCPFSITAPGNYVLGADLFCTGRTGISITASNVSLKLNGHRITALSGGLGIAISVGGGADHVGIQGPGLITTAPNALDTGIDLSGSYSQVSQVTITGASKGINVFLGDFLTLASNVIGHSGVGVSTNRMRSSSLTGNDISGNAVGISLFLSLDNTVNNNVLNGNSDKGIEMFNSGARVYSNVTNGNGNYGILMTTAGNTIFKNTSTANGAFDLSEPFGGTQCNNTWSDNVFFRADASCIR